MDGNGGNGMIIDSYCGSFPHSLLSTSKFRFPKIDVFTMYRPPNIKDQGLFHPMREKLHEICSTLAIPISHRLQFSPLLQLAPNQFPR